MCIVRSAFFLLFLPVLLVSYSSSAQLSADSLKKLCVKRYQADAGIKLTSPTYASAMVNEVFTGRFKNARLFVLANSGATSVKDRSSLFVLDNKTGEEYPIHSLQQLNTFANSTKERLSKLDRAYLYLFVVANVSADQHYAITLPSEYPAQLKDKSVFAGEQMAPLFVPAPTAERLPHMFSNEEINAAIQGSDANTIIMYSFKQYPKSKVKEYTYKYTFTFTDNGDLEQPKIVMYQ